MTNDKIEEVKKETKFILIKKKKHCEEYTVWNKRKDFLGDIAKIKKKFVFYPDSIICKKYIWFRADCLREIASFLDWVNGEQHQETKNNICNEIEATLRTHPHKGLEWGRGYLYSLNELLNKIKGGQI